MPLSRKPPRLRPGDLIGVIAPGSHVPEHALHGGVERLQSLSYRVRYRPDITSEDGNFAGNHDRRAAELLEMLQDPEVRAIFCARGGYGSNYLVPYLERTRVTEPKILMGYSDVTTLQTSLWNQARWVTFQGPMVATEFSLSIDVLGPALETTGPWEPEVGDAQLEVLAEGRGEGTLLGGCLSILVTTLGTPREPEWQDCILFLEDLGEAPYRIDRMLYHLREAGKFAALRGVVFGEMKDCGKPELLRHFRDLSIPVLAGYPCGHTAGHNVCLPMGVRARLENDRLSILEGAVV